jgi:hypothetical protein
MPRVSGLLVAINLVTLAITLMVNALANTLPLNGRTTGAISDRFAANLFAPAGYVFSIWGVIYLGLVAFALYQATPAGRRSRAVGRLGSWFALTGFANSLWIVFWHYEIFPATLVLMLVLLVSLCVIVSRLGAPNGSPSVADRWLVYLPFSLYLGWISVATIANASVFLLSLGWDGAPLAPVAWALILLAVATGLGAWMVLRRGDLAYAAVLVWAFIGIAVKQEAVAWVPPGAWAGVVVIVALSGWRLARGLIARPGAQRPLAS